MCAKQTQLIMFYISFCIIFGTASYLKYIDVKVYNGLDYADVCGIILFAIFTPVFIIIAFAIWCVNQIKTL